MKHKALVVTVAVLALSVVPSAALADIMTYRGVGLNEHVKIHADGLLADELTVRAGQYLVTYKDVDYDAYCVDIDHYAGSGEVEEWEISQLNNGYLVAYLFENHSDDVVTDLDAAALGVAIWEVIYEETGNEFNVDNGYFSITNNDDVAAAANELLAALPDTHTPQWDLTVLHSECKQDMLIGANPIPEPATLVLLGLGGIGVLIRRRRQ